MPRPSYSGSVSFPSIASGSQQSKLKISLLNGEPFVSSTTSLTRYQRLRVFHSFIGGVLVLLPLILAIYVAAYPNESDGQGTNPGDELSPMGVVGVAIYFAVFVNYAIYLAAAVRSRRGVYPFRGTDLPLLVVTWCACVIHVTWVCCAIFWGSFPCLLSSFFCDTMFATLCIPYVVRASRLYLLFGRSPANESSIFGRLFKFLINEKKMLLFYFICAFPFFLLSFITTYASSDLRESLMKTECDASVAFFPGEREAFWGMLNGVELMTYVLCMILTRKVWDGFSMKKELYWGFITFLAVLMPDMYCYLTNSSRHIFGFISLCTLVIRVNILLHVSLAMPLHNSWGITYLPRPPPTSYAQPSSINLKDIIQSPKYFKYWANFMLAYDFQELWAFYVATDMFKEEEDMELRRALGQDICRKYLNVNILGGTDRGPFMQWFTLISHKMSRTDLIENLSKIKEEMGAIVALPMSSRASSRSRKSIGGGTTTRSIPMPIQHTHSERLLDFNSGGGAGTSFARSLPNVAHSLGDTFIVGSEGCVPVGISSTPPDNLNMPQQATELHTAHQLVLEARSVKTAATAAENALSWNQAVNNSTSVDPCLFDAFKESAVKIMEGWCFPKFLESQQYRDLKSLWDAEASVHHRLSRDEALMNSV